MSEITIAVTGLVATAIRHSFTAEGLEISSFRLAATHRKFDRETRSWVDAETNWYSEVSQYLGKLPKRLDRSLSQRADSPVAPESAENWRNGGFVGFCDDDHWRHSLSTVAVIERDDDLDDESYQIRELFAHYGAAMYAAQVFEQGLVNVLTFAQTATAVGGTQTTFDLNFESNLRVTMGRLLRLLTPFLGDDPELAEALGSALELRNRLAHSYWYEHAQDFTTFEGREMMLAEVITAQDTFQSVDARLSPVLTRYMESVGVTRERMDVMIAEELSRLRAEAETRHVPEPE